MPSIFKKVNRDILIEWIYDSNNTIVEPYKVVLDTRNGIRSYVGGDSSVTNNDITNQFIYTDVVTGKYTKLNPEDQSFLIVKDYTPSVGVRHDILKIYLPSNFEFGEHQGVYIRTYSFDFRNKKFFELSNFFFDGTDSQKLYLIDGFTPPKLYQDKTWDKFIQVNIPSVGAVSQQRENGEVLEDSINSNLTNGLGLSITAPIFVDFSFISKITQIGSVKTYITSQKYTTQFPQTFGTEPLTLVVEESPDGDYFEIYPTYEGSFSNFVEFIETSRDINKFYYVEYILTLFEENVKGRPITIVTRDEDLNNKVEWRPLIKYSSTKAILDVEMRLINEVDGSIGVRKAAYGIKSDQLSKYLINLKKINVSGVYKPKIYNKNQNSLFRIDELGKRDQPENRLKVPVPTLKQLENVVAFSESGLNTISNVKIDNYHSIGKLKIGIKPFDNILRFHLATKKGTSLEFIDLTNCQELKIIFKNSTNSYEFSQYLNERSAPKIGVCQFRIPESKFLDIKKLKTGIGSIFYITTTNQGVMTILYAGLFSILDTSINIGIGDTDNNNLTTSSPGDSGSIIIDDPDTRLGTALVRKRLDDGSSIQTRNPQSKEAQINKGFK
jgi:hypothetical protein